MSTRERRLEQIAAAAARCKAAGVPFDPKLPRRFDCTRNEDRPASHQRWWHQPFIVAYTVDSQDDFYAGRTDEHAEAGRKLWDEGRPKWFASWPSGIRYDVRCLDGGAWDRSTWWGSFATIEEALSLAQGGRSPHPGAEHYATGRS